MFFFVFFVFQKVKVKPPFLFFSLALKVNLLLFSCGQCIDNKKARYQHIDHNRQISCVARYEFVLRTQQ